MKNVMPAEVATKSSSVAGAVICGWLFVIVIIAFLLVVCCLAFGPFFRAKKNPASFGAGFLLMFGWLRLHHPASRANKYANKHDYEYYGAGEYCGVEGIFGARRRGAQLGLPL